MPDRTLRLYVLGDSTSGEAALNRVGDTAVATEGKVAKSGEAAGSNFAAGIQKGTTKAAGGLEKLGQTLGQWGIPFSNRIEKIGKDLGSIETRGKGVMEAFSAVGGVATLALVGVGAEAVKISDQFETAQAGLQTAIKNAGGTWSQYKGQIDAAYSSAAKLGFENNDVASGLQQLVTATQDPAKALNDLSTAENIARARHESLTDASGQLAKILGGNTRLLQQWGINLDIGSGKLKSIQSAEESLQKAQLSQEHVQAEVNDGQLKGVNAQYEQQNSLLSVRNATLNLQQAQQAIPDILDAINQRTQGMADAYGKTLPGELQTARAEVHNLGTEFGTALVPGIDKLLGLGADVLGFFDKSKAGAATLATVIGGPLAAAMAVFAYNRAVSLVTGLQRIGSGLDELAAKAVSRFSAFRGAETTAMQDAIYGFTGLETTAGQSEASVNASLAGMQAGTETATSNMRSNLEATKGELASLGPSAAAAETDVAGASGLGGIATKAGDAETAVGGLGSKLLGLAGKAFVVTLTLEIAEQLSGSLPGASANGAGSAAIRHIPLIGGLAANIADSIEHGLGENKAPPTKTYSIHTSSSDVPLSAGTTAAQAAKIQQLVNGGLTVSEAVAASKKSTSIGPAGPSGGGGGGGTTIPDLGGVPPIGGGTGATGPTAAQKALVALEASATSFLAGLADEANPAKNASLKSLQSQLATDTNKKHALAASTLEDKLKTAGQTGLADKIAKAFGEVGTDLQARIKQATVAAANLKVQKKGNTLLGGLESDQSSGNIEQLQGDLSTTNKAAMDRLVTQLNATHEKSLKNIASNLESTWAAANTNLTNLLGLQQQAALADQTQAQANALQTQSAIDQATSTQMIGSIQEAAAAITDSSKISGDISSSATQGITDQTQAMNDSSAAQVQAIQDQTSIQVDQLAETGLYGLQLVAQQAKVALDQQTLIDHQSEAAEQAHLDSVTSQNNLLIASDQLALDKSQQAADNQASIDQDAANATSIKDAINVQTAQSAADAAQAHADAVQWGSALEQQQAQAGLQVAQATLASAQAQASSDSASTQATLQQDQANAAQTIATLTAILNSDQANAGQQIALATQSLAQVTDTANQTEAKLQGIYDVDNAKASSQFSGGGTVIMISGVPLDNVAALGNTVDWAIRTAVPAPVGS